MLQLESLGEIMTQSSSDIRRELVQASHVLAHEDILDGFGHVSARHPVRPDRFLISTVRAPELSRDEDLVELDFNGDAVEAHNSRLFAERFVHAAVYAARPDVMAVCHHHAPAILPFCVTGVPLVPVVHLGATMGSIVPFWDSQDEFGDTNLLVANLDQGRSMARALGAHWTVLLRRHGATVAGRSIRELVFRAIYGARNAEIQRHAMMFGKAPGLRLAESLAAEEFNLKPIALDRNWERWLRRAEAQNRDDQQIFQ